MSSIKGLFDRGLKVINIGLPSFRDGIVQSGASCVHVDWRPPMDVSLEAMRIVQSKMDKITKANEEAVKIIQAGRPYLVGLEKAIDVIPGMKGNLLLHSGPPVSWDRMCGPMRGAIMAALIYEEMAKTPKEAEALAASGRIEYAPCHEHASVGPMAGIISPTMPVFVIKNEAYGNYAYCTMNEGLGRVLRYGAYGEDVTKRLNWMRDALYPVLKKALEAVGGVDLKGIIAQALHMGDEVHNRNRAATSLLYRILAGGIVKTCSDTETAVRALEFIHGNDHFFLNLSMPACKAVLDAARDIKNSSIVVAMARNGTDFGVQLAGTGGRWFTGPAVVPDALFFPGYTKEDANPDIGDSSITETGGLGGFAIAASPAIVQFVGGSVSDAVGYTMQMYEICAAENSVYQIPYLNFRGTPTAIDVVKVVQKNILPFIDTGVAHKKPGIGQVGAGVVRAPAEPFLKAFEGLAETVVSDNGPNSTCFRSGRF